MKHLLFIKLHKLKPYFEYFNIILKILYYYCNVYSSIMSVRVLHISIKKKLGMS